MLSHLWELAILLNLSHNNDFSVSGKEESKWNCSDGFQYIMEIKINMK
jgi:hypothetical protein